MPSTAEHIMHFRHLGISDAHETTPRVLRLAAIFQFETCLHGHRKFKIAQNAAVDFHPAPESSSYIYLKLLDLTWRLMGLGKD